MSNIDKQLFEPAQRLINFFGNQSKTAQALNVKQGTVSGWLTCKHGVGELSALKAEVLTGGEVKAHELCPSLADFERKLPVNEAG